MTRRDLRDVAVGLGLAVLVVVALTTYHAPPSRPAPAPTPAAPASSSAPARVELVRSASRCAPDELADAVDVRLVLSNRGDHAARVYVFAKRSFAGGNDDGSPLDAVRVTVPAHGRRALADTYPAHGARLVECRVWLGDGGRGGGTRDGYRELPIRGAA